MKVLEVAPLREGLQRNITMLNRLGSEMKLIEQSIEGLVALEDSLKGEGGNAIRSFYEECHLPFLQFHSTFQKNFVSILKRMEAALDALEPNPSGVIRESFLEGEIEQGLTEIAQITESLTDEANSIMDQVADIVGLPHLDDSDVQEGVHRAKIKRDDTVTALHEFDANQTTALTPIETDLATMDSWLSDMEKLFRSGLHDVHFQSEQWAAISLNSGLKTALQQEQESLLKACIVNNDQNNLVGKEITPEILRELEGIRTETVSRGLYSGLELLKFHVYENGLIIKESRVTNYPTRYEVVKEVEEEFVDEGVQFLDSYFEGTPLAILDYIHPKSLIQKGFKKFVFAKTSGIKSSKYKGDLSGKKPKDTEHIGKLKGKDVLLKGIYEKEVTYTKRNREELKQLRNKFNSSVRKNFLEDIVRDERKVKQLTSSGLTDKDIKNLKNGLVPDGYQVHHKLPLDDGGTNDFKNLIIIKNDPYHKVLTNTQKDLTKGLEVGDSINIKWPIPEGFIYPTTKK